MTFAEKLRELRDAKELSEVKLAEAAGVPRGVATSSLVSAMFALSSPS